MVGRVQMPLDTLLDALIAWAEREAGVAAIGLVGSHARGAARPDSDVDVLVLADGPGRYLDRTEWLGAFGEPGNVQREDWGAVQSLRVHYRGGFEVEFGLTTPAWADLDPLDPGTRRVVADSCRVVYDPRGLLARLIEAVAASPAGA